MLIYLLPDYTVLLAETEFFAQPFSIEGIPGITSPLSVRHIRYCKSHLIGRHSLIQWHLCTIDTFLACITWLFAYCKGDNYLGVVWLFHLLSKGNRVLFLSWKRVDKLFEPQMCMHFMKILTVYWLNSHLLTLKAHNHKMYVFVVH